MKKLECFSCGAVPKYQLESRPRLFICFRCVQEWVTYLHEKNLVEKNPIAREFIMGFADIESPYVRFWLRSKYDGNAWSEVIYWQNESGELVSESPERKDPLDNL